MFWVWVDNGGVVVMVLGNWILWLMVMVGDSGCVVRGVLRYGFK